MSSLSLLEAAKAAIHAEITDPSWQRTACTVAGALTVAALGGRSWQAIRVGVIAGELVGIGASAYRHWDKIEAAYARGYSGVSDGQALLELGALGKNIALTVAGGYFGRIGKSATLREMSASALRALGDSPQWYSVVMSPLARKLMPLYAESLVFNGVMRTPELIFSLFAMDTESLVESLSTLPLGALKFITADAAHTMLSLGLFHASTAFASERLAATAWFKAGGTPVHSPAGVEMGMLNPGGRTLAWIGGTLLGLMGEDAINRTPALLVTGSISAPEETGASYITGLAVGLRHFFYIHSGNHLAEGIGVVSKYSGRLRERDVENHRRFGVVEKKAELLTRLAALKRGEMVMADDTEMPTVTDLSHQAFQAKAIGDCYAQLHEMVANAAIHEKWMRAADPRTKVEIGHYKRRAVDAWIEAAGKFKDLTNCDIACVEQLSYGNNALELIAHAKGLYPAQHSRAAQGIQELSQSLYDTLGNVHLALRVTTEDLAERLGHCQSAREAFRLAENNAGQVEAVEFELRDRYTAWLDAPKPEHVKPILELAEFLYARDHVSEISKDELGDNALTLLRGHPELEEAPEFFRIWFGRASQLYAANAKSPVFRNISESELTLLCAEYDELCADHLKTVGAAPLDLALAYEKASETWRAMDSESPQHLSELLACAADYYVTHATRAITPGAIYADLAGAAERAVTLYEEAADLFPARRAEYEQHVRAAHQVAGMAWLNQGKYGNTEFEFSKVCFDRARAAYQSAGDRDAEILVLDEAHRRLYHETLGHSRDIGRRNDLIAHLVRLSDEMCAAPAPYTLKFIDAMGMRVCQLLSLPRVLPNGEMTYNEYLSHITFHARGQNFEGDPLSSLRILCHLGFIARYRTSRTPHEQALAYASERWFDAFMKHYPKPRDFMPVVETTASLLADRFHAVAWAHSVVGLMQRHLNGREDTRSVARLQRRLAELSKLLTPHIH